MPADIGDRKSDHLRIAMEQPVEAPPAGGAWACVGLTHQALPEIHRDDVDPRVEILGHELAFPLLVGSMTGGTAEAAEINRRLARAAARAGIGMCLGSQRIMIERPEAAPTFQVRDLAPDILLLANVGAVQLNYGVGAEQIREVADAVGADAVVLHLNAAQEAVQGEGDTRFGGLVAAMERTLPAVGLPCGVKEVGAGFSIRAARRLASLPIAFLESAGRGGTSWTRIEGMRAATAAGSGMGELFADWGVPSVTSLLACVDHGGGVPVIASGGVRSGLDAARALALGARATAMALPLLRAAARSSDAVHDLLMAFREALVTAMFLTGARTVEALRALPYRLAPGLRPEAWEGGRS